MATFLHPAPAVRAVLAARDSLSSSEGGAVPIVLRAGIHYGPCIAVTPNDRLDYFGSSVNIASRLEGLSQGHDVVVSSVVHDDPDVQLLLSDPDRGLLADPLAGTLKGLEDEPITMWSVTLRDTPLSRTPASSVAGTHTDSAQ
jgi:class 3 adenylate cyclase